MQFEDDRMPHAEPRERLEEPRGQRVGVDGERHRDDGALVIGSPQFGQRVMLEERDLAGEPDDGRSGLRRPHRLGAHQHDLPDAAPRAP